MVCGRSVGDTPPNFKSVWAKVGDGMATVDTKERTADDRGRVRIGPEYAGKDVKVVVIDDSENGESEE